MRLAILLAAVAGLTLVGLAACTARNGSDADTTDGDSARAEGSVSDSLAAADDSVTPPASPSRPSASRREADPPRDSTLPPEDSIRAMRPRLPQVVPDSQPGRWRGLKLPEKRPVQPPIEPIRKVEPTDSVMKGDSTPPPPPKR
jgi:hypothetical protein